MLSFMEYDDVGMMMTTPFLCLVGGRIWIPLNSC